MRDELKHIIESLLFVSREPLSVRRIRKVLPHADSDLIRGCLNQLSQEYEARKGGFFLLEVAGGYQLRTRPEYMEWIKRLLKPNPLRVSKAALETLAIIAYRQPVLKSEVEHIRGVDCGGVLKMLLERRLIRVLGRKEIPGRPLIYATTKYFLEVFELRNLKDLPKPDEIDLSGGISLTPDVSDKVKTGNNPPELKEEDEDQEEVDSPEEGE